MKPKVAVIGLSEGPFDKEVSKKAVEIGKEIAKHDCILLCGATTGYTFEAARGAKQENGMVIGISPASNKEEHERSFGMPTENCDAIIYTGFGYKGRNVVLIRSADAVIMIGGKAGTLNEFTIAFALGKPIGVLEGSGGVTALISDIVEVCDKKGEKEKVIYSSAPKELIIRLFQ